VTPHRYFLIDLFWEGDAPHTPRITFVADFLPQVRSIISRGGRKWMSGYIDRQFSINQLGILLRRNYHLPNDICARDARQGVARRKRTLRTRENSVFHKVNLTFHENCASEVRGKRTRIRSCCSSTV
jgi:hypothetical protein